MAQGFAMWMIPGYILYKVNVSDTVKGDIQGELPTRPVRAAQLLLEVITGSRRA